MNKSPQQLELKHLAPYLPYGVHIAYEMFGNKYQTQPITTVHIWGNKINNIDINQIKPLLIPISEITSEEFESFGYKNTGWYVKGIIKNHLLGYKHFEYLISKHYDVFGLIDAGLALNKMDFINI